MDDLIRVYIPTFKKWQKPTSGPRHEVTIGLNVMIDRKFKKIGKTERNEAKCIYVHLLARVNDEGILEATAPEVSATIAEAIDANLRSRFDFKRHLWNLVDARLIQVQINGLDMPRPAGEPPAETGPVLKLKPKTVKENPAPKYSNEAKELAFQFIKHVKANSGAVIKGSDVFKQFQIAESLLVSFPEVDLKAAIDWLMTQPKFKNKITWMSAIKVFMGEYIAAMPTSFSVDDLYVKDRQGRYTVKNDKNPAYDARIPFEQLSFDCMRFRLIKEGLLTESSSQDLVNLAEIADPRLKQYFDEAISVDPYYAVVYDVAIRLVRGLDHG